MNQTFYNISYDVIQQTFNNHIDKDVINSTFYDNVMDGMHNYIILYILLNYIAIIV